MTAKESQILRELIDKNWDFTNEKDVTKKWEIGLKVSELRKKLQDSMGKEEYDKFMDNGRKMFAPKG
jgi:hypothetical protein